MKRIAYIVFSFGIGYIVILSPRALYAQESGPLSPVVDEQAGDSVSAYELLRQRRNEASQDSNAPAPTPIPTPTAESINVPEPATPSPTPRSRFSLPPSTTRSRITDKTATRSTGTAPAITLEIPDPLEIDSASFSDSLDVTGKTSLGATSIAGPLTQDGTLLIDEGNSISVLGETLRLQNLGLGGIDFIDGKMTLDEDGNLSVAGNLDLGGSLNLDGDLYLNGRVSAASGLRTNVISPVGDSNLRIKLGAREASPSGFFQPESRLIVSNRKDEDRLAIDEGGDVSTLGKITSENLEVRNSAQTGDLNIEGNLEVSDRAEFSSLAADQYVRAGEVILDNGLKINRSTAKSGRDPGTGASAGQDQFPAGVFSYTIENTLVTEDSLIYLTARASLEGQTLFIRSILPGRSFTVSLDQPLEEPVPFNWLIIN